MNDTFQIPGQRRRGSRRSGTVSRRSSPRQITTASETGPTIAPSDIGDNLDNAVVVVPQNAVLQCDGEFRSVQPSELDRLYRSFAEVTPENHPRTARLLASSIRKTAQKVIEEAGEVALEAVRHRADAVVRESADLLYHLVALWCRAGIDPEQVWIEMRMRADTLGIAEKLPKGRNDHRSPERQTSVGEK